MKIKLHHLLFNLLLVVGTPAGINCLHAQDASYPVLDSNEEEEDNEREKIIYSSGEGDPLLLLNNKAHVVSARDSAVVKPSTTRTKTQTESAKNSAKPSQGDDSILSFNFLYYLFEKYKLQDIVE